MTGIGYVSQPTKQRILDAAQHLGYHPNLMARSLKTGKSFEVAVILSSLDELYVAKLAALEQTLRAADFSVHILFRLSESGAADPQHEIFNALQVRRPAAVAVFPSAHLPLRETVSRLQTARIPYVVLDSRQEGIDTVQIDRQHGVYEAVRYLAQTGRTRIAYLGPSRDSSRLTGYQRALQELGRPPIVVETTAQSETADAGPYLANLLAIQPRLDAVQVYSDAIAMKLLAACHAQAVRIPASLAVVGFDDRRFAALAWPRLTTVAQPNEAVGRAAAEILLAKIAGQSAPPAGWSRTLPTTLVVRDSA